MLNPVKSLGQIQACKPNFTIPFNAFTANCFKDSQRVVNTGTSSKINLIHWLFCLQQGLQTIMEHLGKNFVCDFEYGYWPPVVGLLQIRTFRNHCEQRVSPRCTSHLHGCQNHDYQQDLPVPSRIDHIKFIEKYTPNVVTHRAASKLPMSVSQSGLYASRR